MSRALDRLLAALDAAGCQPRQTGPCSWVAACPTCRLRGWHAAVEIRAGGSGVVVCCTEAHLPPAPAAFAGGGTA